jgi:hypothetical protein
MTSVPRLHVPDSATRPNAAATRARVRNTPLYRDLRRLLDLCGEVQELASDLAADLPGSPLAALLSDPAETAQHLTILAGVTETYGDLIDTAVPSL